MGAFYRVLRLMELAAEFGYTTASKLSTENWVRYSNAGTRTCRSKRCRTRLNPQHLHALHGFHRMRHFGFLANRVRQGKLAQCRLLLGHTTHSPTRGEALDLKTPELSAGNVASTRPAAINPSPSVPVICRRLYEPSCRAPAMTFSATVQQRCHLRSYFRIQSLGVRFPEACFACLKQLVSHV
jgi:hypothetical protein